jgi:hypothetical protein
MVTLGVSILGVLGPKAAIVLGENLLNKLKHCQFMLDCQVTHILEALDVYVVAEFGVLFARG